RSTTRLGTDWRHFSNRMLPALNSCSSGGCEGLPAIRTSLRLPSGVRADASCPATDKVTATTSKIRPLRKCVNVFMIKSEPEFVQDDLIRSSQSSKASAHSSFVDECRSGDGIRVSDGAHPIRGECLGELVDVSL